jgi:zinc protease
MLSRVLRSPALHRLALLACLQAGCAADEDVDAPPFRFELPATTSQLENGLELVVVPNHTAPVVTALVAFRAGSFIEDHTVNGYSHLFEHMIFQGSEGAPDSGEFRERLRALGASFNATTNVDRVTYFFQAARESLDPALELFAGALREPLLDEARLDIEREVVLAEFDRNESQTDFAGRKAGMSALFGDYLTRLDPLGSRVAVADVTRDDLSEMHGKYYVPNNALLVLSGDVTAEQGRALAERHFGDWPRAPDPLAEPPPQPGPFERDHFEVLAAPVSFTTIDVWWRGPSAGEATDALAGTLLSTVTLNPDHQFRSLVEPKLAFSASLNVSSFRFAGYVHVQVTSRPGNERALVLALWQTLDKLGESGDVSSAQLDTARAEAFRSFLLGGSDPAGVPHNLGYYWGRSDAQTYFAYVDQLYALESDDLERFARTFIRDRPKAVVLSASADVLAEQGIDAAWLRESAR